MLLKIIALIWSALVILLNIIMICRVGSKAKKLEKKEPNNATGYALVLSELGILLPINLGTLAFIIMAMFS